MATNDASPPESPADAPRALTRRLVLGSLAVSVIASGAVFAARMMMTQGQPAVRPAVRAAPTAAPTAWAQLGANATPAPTATPGAALATGNVTPVRFWHPFGPGAGKEPAAHAAIWTAFAAQGGRPVAATAIPSTPNGNLTLALRAAVAADDPPDVVCLDRLALPGALRAAYLLDLAAYAAKGALDATVYYPHVWVDVHVGAVLAAAPFGADARGLWWRNDFLIGQKVDPAHGPNSLQALAALGGPPSVNVHRQTQWGFSPYAGETHPYTWGIPFGARWYDASARQFAPLEPASVAVMTWFGNQSKTGTPPSAPGEPSPLVSGSVAALADGQWLIADLPVGKAAEYGAAPLPPVGPGTATATWSSGFGVAAPRGARTPDQSWALAAYYASAAAALVYMRAGGRRVMPALPALANHADVVAPGPLWQTFLRMLPTAWARPPIAEAALAWSALADAADRVRGGAVTAEIALESVAQVVAAASGVA